MANILKIFKNNNKLRADQVYYNSTTSLLEAMWPIGRGFIDFTNTDYTNYLGFTWERELVGLTPVGYKAGDSDFGTMGKTLGSKTHTHPLSENGGAAWRKYANIFIQGRHSTAGNMPKDPQYNTYWFTEGNTDYESNNSPAPQAGISLYGNTDSASSIQPSKVVAYWKRVS